MSLLAGGFILAISSAFVTKKPTSFTYFFNDGSCQSITTNEDCESPTGTECSIITASGNTWLLHKISCTGAVGKHGI